MGPKSGWSKNRERWISTVVIIVLLIIATLAPCIIMYVFASIGQ